MATLEKPTDLKAETQSPNKVNEIDLSIKSSEDNNQKHESNFDELNKEASIIHSQENKEEQKEENIPSINFLKKTPSKKSSSSKPDSSKINNRRYGTDIDQNEQNKEEDNKAFISEGKFMQINPHFNIFNKQIESLRESIYTDAKKCLILKGSIQESSNFLKEKSNDVIKDIVRKIYDLRELLEKGNKGLNKTTQEVIDSVDKLKRVQIKSRKEIIASEKRISECENQIGYKLLGKPCYSFMQNNNITNIKVADNSNNKNEGKEGNKTDNNDLKYEI